MLIGCLALPAYIAVFIRIMGWKLSVLKSFGHPDVSRSCYAAVESVYGYDREEVCD